jgi:CO/xanthine dehydrogenase FAD-binding subunit
MSIEQYLTPEGIDECLALLSRFEGRAMLIAGGPGLMPKLAQKKREPTILVDVTRIENFCDLVVTHTDLIVGAGTRIHTNLIEAKPASANDKTQPL